jgi:hypothetical protein
MSLVGGVLGVAIERGRRRPILSAANLLIFAIGCSLLLLKIEPPPTNVGSPAPVGYFTPGCSMGSGGIDLGTRYLPKHWFAKPSIASGMLSVNKLRERGVGRGVVALEHFRGSVRDESYLFMRGDDGWFLVSWGISRPGACTYPISLADQRRLDSLTASGVADEAV